MYTTDKRTLVAEVHEEDLFTFNLARSTFSSSTKYGQSKASERDSLYILSANTISYVIFIMRHPGILNVHVAALTRRRKAGQEKPLGDWNSTGRTLAPVLGEHLANRT